MTMLNDLIRQALNNPPPQNPTERLDPTGILADSVESVLTEATGGTGHIVRVEGREWVLQHPLPERFEPEGYGVSLLDCKFNRLVSAAMAGGAMFDGTHRVWIDRGVLQWEEIE